MLYHFTTIIPFGVEAQLEKLKTWHTAHGQPVYTLNHSRETALIKPHLPDWVIPLERRFARAYGRDYLPFTEICAAGRSRRPDPEDRILLVNSDISLADPEQLPKLRNNAADLVFGSRMDVTETGRPAGHYRKGYDVFSLRAAALDVLDMPDFYMGIPWWDYVLPLTAILGGYSVERLDTDAFHHELHPQRWSLVSFDHIGWQCMQRLLPPELGGGLPSHRRVLAFAQATNRFLNDLAPSTGTAERPETIRDRFLEHIAAEPEVLPSAGPAGRAGISGRRGAPAFPELLAQIRNLATAPPVSITAGHADLGPDLWLSADPSGRAEMACSPGEEGWRLRLKAGDSGNWACLGLRLPAPTLQKGRALGVLIGMTPRQTGRFTPTLRYYLPEGAADVPGAECLFPKDEARQRLVRIPLDGTRLAQAQGCEVNLFFHGPNLDTKIALLEPLLIN